MLDHFSFNFASSFMFKSCKLYLHLLSVLILNNCLFIHFIQLINILFYILNNKFFIDIKIIIPLIKKKKRIKMDKSLAHRRYNKLSVKLKSSSNLSKMYMIESFDDALAVNTQFNVIVKIRIQ